MSNTPKQVIQNILIAKRHKEYQAQITKQSVPSLVWLKNRNKEILDDLKRQVVVKKIPSVCTMSYSEVTNLDNLYDEINKITTDIIIFTSNQERLVKEAEEVVSYFFAIHEEWNLAYGDEKGWFKPDWSPDTLQSLFYFGNIFAVRTKSLLDSAKEIQTKWLQLAGTSGTSDIEIKDIRMKNRIYSLVLECLDTERYAGHMEYMIDQGDETKDWGYENCFAEVKKNHVFSDADVSRQDKKVSILILSKDHPELLSHCVHSIREFTSYRNVEIIVIDNGSSPENRKLIERIQSQTIEEASFRYIYEPMEFNFSKLCNYAATFATGEFFLFLNDDTEVHDPEWLTIMMQKAVKPYVGAVGIKLLYPDATIIQHAGVTNIHLGPAHKLQQSSDRDIHYHGWNRLAVNTSGVTGACMLMRREVFEQVGGFKEELQVAFNDVELCFHILQEGYYNVCCNNTWMFHKESVSRGSDEGKKKLERLHQERDTLYGLHPNMWNYDPYYNRAFIQDRMDRGFLTGETFSEKECSQHVVPIQINGQIAPEWLNEVLAGGVEFAGDAGLWYQGKSGSGKYYIQGWFGALQVDNSRYEISMILRKLPSNHQIEGVTQEVTGDIWKMPIYRLWRPDLALYLPFIDHAALSGASIWFDRDALPEGEYVIGYLWEDACSRQKMYAFTAEALMIQHKEADTGK